MFDLSTVMLSQLISLIPGYLAVSLIFYCVGDLVFRK